MANVDLFGKPIKEKSEPVTPHLAKLKAALCNPKCKQDIDLIEEALDLYAEWTGKLNKLTSKGKKRVEEMVGLLNWYKDELEVELIMKRGSNFLKRQKGQLKLDNTILEEFFIQLINPDILNGLGNMERLVVGPQETFMSLAFLPKSFDELGSKPNVVLKSKDQDFIIGTKIFYRFAPDEGFQAKETAEGSLVLAVLAAEFKVNLDKTMFQEAAGTAARLKQGCPMSRYFVLVEYLDMEPEDCRLTAIDNVFLLRHAKRLPFEKRNVTKEVESQHKNLPIDPEISWRFIQEIQTFINTKWYDPTKALERGSFV
jgi:hypothetical protein